MSEGTSSNQIKLMSQAAETVGNFFVRRSKVNLSGPYQQILFYTVVFLSTALFAGFLTGLGTAASIINFATIVLYAPLSIIFSPVTAGVIILSIFLMYAIPWAIVYIPDIGKAAINSLSTYFNPKGTKTINFDDKQFEFNLDDLNGNDKALTTVHKYISNVLRKISRNKMYCVDGDTGSLSQYVELISKGLINHMFTKGFQELLQQNSEILNTYTAHREKHQGDEDNKTLRATFLQDMINTSDTLKLAALFTEKSIELKKHGNVEEFHQSLIKISSNITDQKFELEKEGEGSHYIINAFRDTLIALNDRKDKDKTIDNQELYEQYYISKNIVKSMSTSGKEFLEHILMAQNIKTTADAYNSIDKKQSNTQYLLDMLANFMGTLNAIFGNAVGLSPSALYIIAPFLFIFGIPSFVISAPLGYTLVALFAIAGGIAAYGLTRNNMRATAQLFAEDIDEDKLKVKLDRKATRSFDINSMYVNTLKFFEQNTFFAYTMSIIMALAVSSFNFMAGVIFVNLLINPSLVMHPTMIASFTITNINALTTFELIFGWAGFGLTFFAVTPLMANAVAKTTKSLSEGIMQSPTGWLVLVMAVTCNTCFWLWMMFRPDSALSLILPQYTLTILPWIATPSIVILSAALLYISIKDFFDCKGYNFQQTLQDLFSSDPALPVISEEFKSDFKDYTSVKNSDFDLSELSSIHNVIRIRS